MAPRRIESLYAVSCYVEIIAESIQKVNKNYKKHSDFRKNSTHFSLGVSISVWDHFGAQYSSSSPSSQLSQTDCWRRLAM